MTSPKAAPHHGRAGKPASFSLLSVLVLCGVSFFAGRFAALPRALPPAGDGVRSLLAAHRPPPAARCRPAVRRRPPTCAPLPSPWDAQPTVVGSAPGERRSALEQDAAGAVPTPVQLRQARRCLRYGALGVLPPPPPPAPLLALISARHCSFCRRLQTKYVTAEEALEATGFLSDRPPQAHGETGHSFYTVQACLLGGRLAVCSLGERLLAWRMPGA